MVSGLLQFTPLYSLFIGRWALGVGRFLIAD
jgi:hypothetical protein